MKYQNQKIIILILLLFSYAFNCLADNGSWQHTGAQLKVVAVDTGGTIKEDSILDMLLKKEQKNFDEIVEHDKRNVLIFRISYHAPVKFLENTKPTNTLIHQDGLFRVLDPKLQSHFEAKGILNRELDIDVIYLKEDPISIVFQVENKIYEVPFMVTDVIDESWRKSD